MQDGQGRFEYHPKSPTPTQWDSDKIVQHKSKLFVPHGSTIDVPDKQSKDVDLKFFSEQGIAIPTSPATSPTEEESYHVRTKSFDLHDIKPTPPQTKRTWRSVSAQPDMEDESDTTPLVDRQDPKNSSLRRKGCIKRPSRSPKSTASLSGSEGARGIRSLSKAPSKSTTDISKIGISKVDDVDFKPTRRYQVDTKKPAFNKRTGHWVSMMDDHQRVLLFTPHYHVVKNCDKASKFTFDVMELNLTLNSVTISLVDNNTNREVLLLSVQP